MHMKTSIVRISAGALGIVGLLASAVPAYAQEGRGIGQVRKEIRQEVRQEVRENIRENIKEKMASSPAAKAAGAVIGKRAAVGQVTVTAINGTALAGATFTVTDKDGKTLTIQTDDKTQYRRRFWGKIESISEISAGNKLTVVGQWADEAKTTVKARLIRDMSIQKRHGVFFGTVKSISSTGWVMETKRGDQTITVSSTTKLVNRKEEAITQANIVIGHRVRVKGLWDMTAKTVTSVTHVKDYDLPARPTPKVSPALKISPTPTTKP